MNIEKITVGIDELFDVIRAYEEKQVRLVAIQSLDQDRFELIYSDQF